jgi:hypothetical protein
VNRGRGKRRTDLVKQLRKDTQWFSVFAASVVVLAILAEVKFDVRASWYVAAFAGIATYIITFQLVDWWRDRRPFTYVPPSDLEIVAAYEDVRRYAEGLGPVRPGMIESATFLLDEAKGDFERVISSSDSHEEKARAVLAIVAGATSALGIFGVAKDGRIVALSPIIVDSLIFVLVAFVCLLYVLRAKRYKRTKLDSYFVGGMAEPELRVALRLSLTQGYAKMTSELAHRIRHEPRALFIAYIAVVVAAVLVLLNSAVVNSGPAPTPGPAPSTPAVTNGTPTPGARVHGNGMGSTPLGANG